MPKITRERTKGALSGSKTVGVVIEKIRDLGTK